MKADASCAQFPADIESVFNRQTTLEAVFDFAAMPLYF
jgi:hypothetical protein